ncbi:MAG: FAD-dependent oxidoreductase, partial [Winogradskyella sp.]|nr:FAD-dependent oxidoreductase [Winogradskyella sp.]
PNVSIDAVGAIYYKCDSHSTPHEFMREMKALLIKKGVTIFSNEKVEDVIVGTNKITAVVTHRQTLKADEFVLAAGSWSNLLSKKLNIRILLEAGKGYRINTTQSTGISIPAILAERKVAVTPMHGFTRFSGTMEIAGINHNINKVRVNAIANAVASYYPEINVTTKEKEAAACGLRPVSPDGLPYIGRSAKCTNLTIATGHAMMGWSMATASGTIVSEIITHKKPSLVIRAYHPDRTF